MDFVTADGIYAFDAHGGGLNRAVVPWPAIVVEDQLPVEVIEGVGHANTFCACLMASTSTAISPGSL